MYVTMDFPDSSTFAYWMYYFILIAILVSICNCVLATLQTFE